MNITCAPVTLNRKLENLSEKVFFFFFVQRTPHICFRLLKLLYRIRQYDECQQVSAITLAYLQFKLAQLSVFFVVVWHSANSRVAVKPQPSGPYNSLKHTQCPTGRLHLNVRVC